MSINYQKIVDGLDDNKVKNLLTTLDIPYRDIGHALLMPTVCHNDDVDGASWKLYYYKNTHVFNCYTECGAMSIFTFLKHYYETRNIQYDWFNDIYALVTSCSSVQFHEDNPDWYQSIRDDYSQRKERRELTTYPNGLIEVFTKYYPIEWLNDGITKETMDKFNIRFSQSQNKIIIPHYDINNHLIGIRGRALNKWEIDNVGKYMPVQIEGKWYSHPLSLNLYGLNFNKDNITKSGLAILVEAEKSVMQAESFSFPNCTAAVCGSKLNKYALDLLIRTCWPREVIIAFDQEEEPGEHKYFDNLYAMCKKYNQYVNFSFIYDRDKLLSLKDSPTDRGEEVFKTLLNRRVKV